MVCAFVCFLLVPHNSDDCNPHTRATSTIFFTHWSSNFVESKLTPCPATRFWIIVVVRRVDANHHRTVFQSN